MSVARVHYRERQPLRATDLCQEQAYHVGMRRRHHIAHHGWGIVTGLGVTTDAVGRFIVNSGMAIDGYGRELIVPEPCLLPVRCFEELACDTIDVWLVYSRRAETPPQHGRWDCGPGQHTRWREEARLRLVPADSIDPCQPPDTPVTDCTCSAQEEPLDDAEREWPVYLGRIGQPRPEDTPPRRYVTLTGETITAPSGRARVQVGSATSGDRRFFAVQLRNETGIFTDRFTINRDGQTTIHGDTTLHDDLIVGSLMLRSDDLKDSARLARTLRDAQDPLTQYLRRAFPVETAQSLAEYRGACPPSGALQVALVTELNRVLDDVALYNAQRFAHVRLRQETDALGTLLEQTPQTTQNREFLQRLFNRLLLEDGYPEAIVRMGVTPGVEFRPLAASPEEAAPWQIYHAVESQDGAPIHQLRLELAHPADKGEASLYKLVIGHADSSGFIPCLTVTADCTVTVHGNLAIQGQLVQRPIQADPDDPRFADALLDQWLQWTTSTGTVLVPLGLELTAPAEVQAGATLNYTITVRNISTRAVASVQIRGTLTVQRRGRTVARQSIEEDFPVLEPGQQENILREYTVPRPSAPGVVIIAVTALGVGPAGNIVHTEAQRIVRVTVPEGSEPEGVL
jgi:hypothetical protein